jgi:hypothetical protein
LSAPGLVEIFKEKMPVAVSGAKGEPPAMPSGSEPLRQQTESASLEKVRSGQSASVMAKVSKGSVPAAFSGAKGEPLALSSGSKPFRQHTDSAPREDVVPDRDPGVAQANAVFRIFIWRDMLKELLQERPFFGFSFGKPQRSRSLEILNWATGEWSRDGYITPHNSFLHYIYRGGVVGVIVICSILWLVWAMTRDFLKVRSVFGGFLVGVIVYGIIHAQFAVFLELPYNAIPFWTFFGMTLAYCHKLKGSYGQ